MTINFLWEITIYHYLHLQIKLDLFVEVADAINAVPQTYQKRPELLEQRTAAGNFAKDKGNACLKDGDFDDAIAYYTLATSIDPSNHVLYSNRCAAFQQKKSWSEGVADAEKVC